MVEVELMSVDCWVADTPLDTLWSPVPTLTPGLMLAPALMSVLLMPTFASTPTFGLTLTVLPLGLLVPVVGDWLVVEDWLVVAPWLMVADELTSVDCWVAVTLLSVVFVWAFAGPKAPITAAATPVKSHFGTRMISPFGKVAVRLSQASCPPRSSGGVVG